VCKNCISDLKVRLRLQNCDRGNGLAGCVEKVVASHLHIAPAFSRRFLGAVPPTILIVLCALHSWLTQAGGAFVLQRHGRKRLSYIHYAAVDDQLSVLGAGGAKG
jgi:hypothetical protein